MNYWAIAYTKPRFYIFEDTIRRYRKEAWQNFLEGLPPELVAKAKRHHGAKAVKVRVEVIE